MVSKHIHMNKYIAKVNFISISYVFFVFTPNTIESIKRIKQNQKRSTKHKINLCAGRMHAKIIL